MCLYIYAPNHTIELQYVAEDINLMLDGSAIITIDILINNLSLSPISELFCLIPHRFFSIQAAISSKKMGLKKRGYYSDNTHELTLKGDKSNARYESKGCQLISENISGGQRITVSEPDFKDPTKTLNYSGKVLGPQMLEYYSNLHILQWELLQNPKFNFTLFKCGFVDEIENKQPRWIRWKFHPLDFSIYPYGFRRKASEYFQDNLEYDYEITSPFRVRDRFIEKLTVAKDESIKQGKTKVISHLNELQLQICKNGFKKRSCETQIKHWKVIIFPGNDMRTRILSWTGDIKPVGSMPTYIENRNEKLKCYMFRDILKSGIHGSSNWFFEIYAQAKIDTTWMAKTTWIALLLSISALIYALVPVTGKGQTWIAYAANKTALVLIILVVSSIAFRVIKFMGVFIKKCLALFKRKYLRF